MSFIIGLGADNLPLKTMKRFEAGEDILNNGRPKLKDG
jgi:hypothetical protein